MAYWLMKTEPEAFSLDDLAARGKEPWDGIRNYQARNFLRSMQFGDGIFLYHSRVPVPGIVGLAEVRSSAHPDPTQFDPRSKYFDPNSRPEQPRWDLVDVGFRARFAKVISLEELRQWPVFADSPLVRKGNRLSILPISETQWAAVLEHAELV
ncbi:EVE domain-containing protein [Acidithiobacillus sp. VAN18-1]|uniref:EVE domain-containing protein n=1 Tax=Igneacidithiobacillus copahuensis TaxID=2724909 RepID=A0AAE3CKR3_9PROT|nr:EVE domain-containing protein [Igneacidithiobacillus copahuensis]MBU2789019.1 EVE domain-containing protein [Igneacidithiobacillus copahuensis]MBU2795640.1 EVE domain-containing protein [Acidithiobacillus sp. VAN18-2]